MARMIRLDLDRFKSIPRLEGVQNDLCIFGDPKAALGGAFPADYLSCAAGVGGAQGRELNP